MSNSPRQQCHKDLQSSPSTTGSVYGVGKRLLIMPAAASTRKFLPVGKY